jgi:hypothetical protein
MKIKIGEEDILYVQEHKDAIDKSIDNSVYFMNQEPLSLYRKDCNGKILKLLGCDPTAYVSYAFARQYGLTEIQSRYYAILKRRKRLKQFN